MGFTPLRIGKPITVRRSLAVLGLALLPGLAACGARTTGATATTSTTTLTTTTTPPPTTTPEPTPRTTTPATTSPPTTSFEPCGRPVTTTSAAVALPASAALLSATVIVDSRRGSPPRCVQLAFGQTVHLHLDDRAEFVANSPPQLTPPDGNVVAVTTRPGPTGQFAGLTTIHVVVTLTAAHAGTVSVRWTDCTGTGC